MQALTGRMLLATGLLLTARASADECGLSPLCVTAETRMRTDSTSAQSKGERVLTSMDWTPWKLVLDLVNRRVSISYRYGGHDCLTDGAGPGAAWVSNDDDYQGCLGSVSSGKVTVIAGGRHVQLYFVNDRLVRVDDPKARRPEGDSHYCGLEEIVMSLINKEDAIDGSVRQFYWDARNVQACPVASSQPTNPPASSAAPLPPGKVKAPATPETSPGGGKVEPEKAPATPLGRRPPPSTPSAGAAGAKEVWFGQKSKAVQEKEKAKAEQDFADCRGKPDHGSSCAAAGSYYYVNDEPKKAKALWSFGCKQGDKESCRLSQQFFGK